MHPLQLLLNSLNPRIILLQGRLLACKYSQLSPLQLLKAKHKRDICGCLSRTNASSSQSENSLYSLYTPPPPRDLGSFKMTNRG